MARNFGGGGPDFKSSISPRLESQPSTHYIDMRFSGRHSSEDYRPSDVEGYDSEDFIELNFPQPLEIYATEASVEKLHGVQSPSGADQHGRGSSARVQANTARMSGLEILTADVKEMRFPRVSGHSFKVDVEDFYTALTVGLDSLERLADSAFLTVEFLEQSIGLLLSIDKDVRILVENLGDLRHPSSVEFGQVVTEYMSVSGKILDVCGALKFTTTLLKAYHNSHVDAAVTALEGLVSLSSSVASRSVHVVMAKEAGRCIDNCQVEMAQMQKQVKRIVESSRYGNLSYFVPNLNLTNTEYSFTKWTGLWGVLFALKTAGSYICQLFLAAFAYAGEGPLLVASTKVASFNSGWATSLMNLHIHARKQFNKMKDSSRSSCTFMSPDNHGLEYMLQDTKDHLQSLLNQGKFLNMGVYIGSWQADRKKLRHNVPLLREHFVLVRDRLSILTGDLQSLTTGMIEGRRYLAQLSLGSSPRQAGSLAMAADNLHR